MSKTILLVEDEEHDVMFMQFAMEAANMHDPLKVVSNGRDAVAYLEGEGKHADRNAFPLPGLVLLDLRLPFIPGLEVLKRMRELPHLDGVPVIILSSSNQESDIETAYHLGANAFIVKPSYTELVPIVRRIKQYWLDSEGPPPDCKDWLSVIVSPQRTSAHHG